MLPLERIVKYVFYAILLLALALLALRCQKQKWLSIIEDKHTSIHHMVVEKMEDLGRIELVKYRIKDVVEEKIERSWIKGGDTRVLVIVGGEAVGCIDLAQVKEDDIILSDKEVTVYLPQPELCYAKVNHNDSKVYFAPASPFTNNAGAVDSAYRNAENKIRAAAMEMGILEQTRENAGKTLKPLFEALTGKTATLVFKK